MNHCAGSHVVETLRLVGCITSATLQAMLPTTASGCSTENEMAELFSNVKHGGCAVPIPLHAKSCRPLTEAVMNGNTSTCISHPLSLVLYPLSWCGKEIELSALRAPRLVLQRHESALSRRQVEPGHWRDVWDFDVVCCVVPAGGKPTGVLCGEPSAPLRRCQTQNHQENNQECSAQVNSAEVSSGRYPHVHTVNSGCRWKRA